MLVPDTQQSKPESIEIGSDNLDIDETLVDTVTPISNSEMIVVLQKSLEEFQRSTLHKK